MSVVAVLVEGGVQVLEWVALLQEAWDLSSSTVASLPCQKRAVCEIWRYLHQILHPTPYNGYYLYAELKSTEGPFHKPLPSSNHLQIATKPPPDRREVHT